jgi:HAD domain in Swiss Army Knife RNA repair proteins
MKTIFLLDVDGVLNASKAGWSRAPRKGYAYADGQNWKMQFEPALMSRIALLNARPDVEVLWATSWVGHTDQLERLFRLPALLSAGSRSMSNLDKLVAAMEVLYSGNRLVWADDEAIPDSGKIYDWVDEGKALLITPKPSRGLRSTDLDTIENFVLGS